MTPGMWHGMACLVPETRRGLGSRISSTICLAVESHRNISSTRYTYQMYPYFAIDNAHSCCSKKEWKIDGWITVDLVNSRWPANFFTKGMTRVVTIKA